MSRISSQGLQTLGGNGVTLTLPGTPWEFSDYVELTPAMDVDGAIAGIAVAGDSGGGTEFHIGIGPEGAEDPLPGHFRVAGASGSHGGNFDIMLPTPLNVLTVGARVAVRARSGATAIAPTVTLPYYPSPSFSELTTIPISSAPRGEGSPSLTLTGLLWEWTEWQELTAGESEDIGVYGLACYASDDGVVYDVQIGTGPEGSELPTLGTHRFASPLYWEHILFTVAHLVTAGKRVAFRIRSDGTTTATVNGALLFYARVRESESAHGVVGPHMWIDFNRTQVEIPT